MTAPLFFIQPAQQFTVWQKIGGQGSHLGRIFCVKKIFFSRKAVFHKNPLTPVFCHTQTHLYTTLLKFSVKSTKFVAAKRTDSLCRYKPFGIFAKNLLPLKQKTPYV